MAATGASTDSLSPPSLRLRRPLRMSQLPARLPFFDPLLLLPALDDLGCLASPPCIPASKKHKGVDHPVPPPPQKKSKVAYSCPGLPLLINHTTKPKPRSTTWAGIAHQAATMPPLPPGLGLQHSEPTPLPSFLTGLMKTSTHHSVPSFTSEGPTWKQILVSFRGTPSDLTKFFTESAVRVVNGYLRDGHSMLKVTSISCAYDGMSLTTPTIASLSDLDIVCNFVHNSLPMDTRRPLLQSKERRKITQEVLEKALRASVHTEVFAYLSTKPWIDCNLAHSTSCTVYCNIWDSQQGTRTKKALGQPVFLTGCTSISQEHVSDPAFSQCDLISPECV
ncbi:unnamed protein product [Cyclocybe aegerita]|uniref:Uncharacterized protein n=1 Tax=Cyclocybe aegerita TaxID=1973307 RepID=A0A8S0WBN7_CYCAE|nr:unnamed protein product [Cyclocybe aegerita]